MKKALIATILVLSLISISGQAEAVVLPPTGGSGVPTPLASPGGTLLASLNIPFAALDVNNNVWSTGTLQQWVRSNATGLLFEYMVTVNAGSKAGIDLIQTTDYDGFSTDVDTDGTGVTPLSLARSAGGNTITFSYLPGSIGTIPIVANVSSDLLWIQTNAPVFQLNGSTQLQGTGNTRLSTYCPSVPEPASVALLGIGLFGIGGVLRKKFMA